MISLRKCTRILEGKHRQNEHLSYETLRDFDFPIAYILRIGPSTQHLFGLLTVTLSFPIPPMPTGQFDALMPLMRTGKKYNKTPQIQIGNAAICCVVDTELDMYLVDIINSSWQNHG